MKSKRNKFADQAIDAVLGYAVVTLGLGVFIVGLTVVVAAVRLVVGGAQ